MHQLLKALGPNVALVMSFNNDGTTNWGDSQVILLTGLEDADAPPISHQRLTRTLKQAV